jgi:hypothetical protein
VGGAPVATNDQIGAATLGTVANHAVKGAKNQYNNPEGAEATTGGTGTPRS